MSRIAYVNGRYLRHAEASVHIEDRGYQFADAIYEVIAVADGNLVDEAGHLDRLERSLGELRIRLPMSRAALRHVLAEVIRRNRIRRGIVYIQITRGVARRDHVFPSPDTKPSLIVTARRPRSMPPGQAERGVAVITLPDIRWKRCDIKSVALLPNVLGKQAAKEAGAYEAWFVDDAGNVTEGTASNAWIVTDNGEIVTRQLDQGILAGVTRRTVMAIATGLNLKLVERAFTLAEAKSAKEAFVTGTTSIVMPVVRIDDAVIGNGLPGPVALGLRSAYERAVAEGKA